LKEREDKMALSSDAQEISFSCPNCGHELKKPVGWLTANDHVVCPGCGGEITLKTDEFAEKLREVENAINSIPKNIPFKL
jgi:hypothetical protein